MMGYRTIYDGAVIIYMVMKDSHLILYNALQDKFLIGLKTIQYRLYWLYDFIKSDEALCSPDIVCRHTYERDNSLTSSESCRYAWLHSLHLLLLSKAIFFLPLQICFCLVILDYDSSNRKPRRLFPYFFISHAHVCSTTVGLLLTKLLVF